MPNNNRDLWVMYKADLMSQHALEYEVSKLHELLFQVERLKNVAKCVEIFDLNKYKIIKTSFSVKDYLRQKSNEGFVFVFFKN